MRGTMAVGSDQLGYAGDATEQPLCPACHNGRLHPYSVMFEFPLVVNGLHQTSERVDWLEGWVAVCVGNDPYLRALAKRFADIDEKPDLEDKTEPCGFSMALTPRQRQRPS